MPETVTRLGVFIASPGDVAAERATVRRVVAEINETVASAVGVVLEPVMWESHTHPGLGVDVQAVINRQIEPEDVLVCVLWKRLGTPTGRGSSGTVEEFEIAFEKHEAGLPIRVLAYFKTADFLPASPEEAVEFARVLEFKATLSGRGVAYREFRDVSEFEELVRKHLTQLVFERDITSTESPSREPTVLATDVSQVRPEIEAQFGELIRLLASERLVERADAAARLTLLLSGANPPELARLLPRLAATLRIRFDGRVRRDLVKAFEVMLRGTREIGRVLGEEVGSVDLVDTWLPRVDLSNLDLREADIAFAHLRGARLRHAKLFRIQGIRVDLTNADLSGADLGEARLNEAVASNCKFHDSRLVSATFKYANLEHAEFYGAQAQQADFRGARLGGALFTGANVADADFRAATVDARCAGSLAKAKNWSNAKLDPDLRRLLEEITLTGAK